MREAFLKAFDGPPVDLWPLFDALQGLLLALIRGANSDLLTPDTAQKMRARRPDMAFTEVPDRAHIPFLDEPEAVALIRAFLGNPAMNIAMIEAAATRMQGRPPHPAPERSAPRQGRRTSHLCQGRVPATDRQLQGARGGWSAVSALSPEARGRGVIAYSSGNHAQGVAYAATKHGAPCVILMPSDAPQVKIANTRAYGAEVVLYDRATEDRDRIGAQIAADRGLSLIKPYDDPQVIAGQGTVGLELAEQAARVGITDAPVFVCCGGGGLSSGIALACETRAPGLQVRTAEPHGFDDMARSLAWSKGTQRRPQRLDLRRDPDPHPGRADLSHPPASRRAWHRRHR